MFTLINYIIIIKVIVLIFTLQRALYCAHTFNISNILSMLSASI